MEVTPELANRMAAFTSELVAVATENPPGSSYEECVNVLLDQLGRLGLPAEAVEITPGRRAVRSWVGEGNTFYLHGHYDVVPASAPRQFEPFVEDGWLWGRGGADMKGGVVSMMFALASLRTKELRGRAELLLVPDEETGGELGSRRLLEMGVLGKEGIGAVIGEPTSGVIWNGNRGAVTLRVKVKGKPAHVGLQFQGANAFEGAIPILRALESLKREVEERRTGSHISPEEAGRSILMLGGEVGGGHQFNVVPDRFSFTLERRFNPEEELETEKERVLEVIRESAPQGTEVEVETLQEGSASSVQESAPLCRVLGQCVEEVTGTSPAYELCPGLLESRYYAEAGVPAVAYGPGELEVAHGPQEKVSVSRVVECARIYALAATRILSVS